MAMWEQSSRDLNHPYAYQYSIENGPTRFSSLETDGAVRAKSGASRYVSTIVSAVVHATLLVVAALIVAVLPESVAIELEITKAPLASEQPVETFVMDQEVDTPESEDSDTAFQPTEPEFQIDEVTLDAELAFNDAMQTEAVSTPSTNPATTESKGQGSKFFGMAAYGDHFVYVFDISGSMSRQSKIGDYSEANLGGESPIMIAQVRGRRPSRFDIARNELLRSVENLTDQQSFCIILFNGHDEVMFGWDSARLMVATDKNKQRLSDWMFGVRPRGGTNPADALRRGFNMQPDAIFLLSDGEFNRPSDADRVLNENMDRKIPLHTVAFESVSSRSRLRRYSEATNGRHRYVGSQSKAELLIYDLNSMMSDSREAMESILENKISLSEQEKAQVGLSCCKHLRSTRRVMIRLAHECLVLLTDGQEDFGPQNRGKRKVVARSFQLWMEYWNARLRESSG